MGTDHMLVCLVDRILGLFDNNPDPIAVTASLVDWTAAFDRQDPTLAIQNFLKMGVRPSIISLIPAQLSGISN